MATNKHAVIRYQALDKCFRNTGKRHCAEDLLAACNEALYSMSDKTDGIKRRQLFDDIRFMERDASYSIDLVRQKDGRKVYYRYKDPKFSINNGGLNDFEATQIKEALLILSRFKGLPQFEWVDETIAKFESRLGLKKGAEKIVAFDENKDYTAVKYISPLFNAILNKQVLQITYRGFKQQSPQAMIFHPYFLKQYNNRWFCFGLHKDHDPPTVLALDRIADIQNHKSRYINNNDIDFSEYFEDVVGVTVSGKVQKITIKITKEHWPYIQSKPLHGSQKIKLEGDEFVIVSIEVKPNYELQSLLLSHGNKIEIMEPKSYRELLAGRITMSGK